MKLAIAYSHTDVRLALRLLLWIKHLGGIKHPLIVVATQRAAKSEPHRRIAALLAEEFPGAEHVVCPTEDERGWPHSCTHLFGETLRAANDDIFFLEPDAVPMRKGWLDRLVAEYRKAGTPFMGAIVPKGKTCPEHMSGIAFYPREWAKYAPKLGAPQKKGMGAWDVDNAEHVLPHTTPTKSIQHMWVRNYDSHAIDLKVVLPETEVFHQSKDGGLFDQIDPSFAGAALTLQWCPVTTSNSMKPRYFLTENVSVELPIKGKKVTFEPVQYFNATNSWWGVVEVTDPDIATALQPFADAGRILEISADDFDKYMVKKKTGTKLLTSTPLNGPLDPAPVVPVAAPAAPTAPAKPATTLDQVLKPRSVRSRQ